MFLEAKPIWAKGKTKEKNIFMVCQTKLEAVDAATLHIAGTVFYRVYVNDEFLCFGPARAAAGYVREDVIPLPQIEGECVIRIEAVGYYCKSISTVMQPSMLMAEIQCENQVVAYTGKDFNVYLPKHKVQKVERYSAQRHFTEIWDYTDKKDIISTECETEFELLENEVEVIERKAPYPSYHEIELKQVLNKGSYEFQKSLPYKQYKYSWQMSNDWGYFEWDEIEHHPFCWAQRLNQIIKSGVEDLPVTVGAGEYVLLDFERVEAGFLKASMEALKNSDIVISFCEYFEGNTFSFQNMNVHRHIVSVHMYMHALCVSIHSLLHSGHALVIRCMPAGVLACTPHE